MTDRLTQSPDMHYVRCDACGAVGEWSLEHTKDCTEGKMTDSEKLDAIIKPLEWVGEHDKDGDYQATADAPGFAGSYTVVCDDGVCVWHSFFGYHDWKSEPADSVDEAKELAWSNWRERISKALLKDGA